MAGAGFIVLRIPTQPGWQGSALAPSESPVTRGLTNDRPFPRRSSNSGLDDGTRVERLGLGLGGLGDRPRRKQREYQFDALAKAPLLCGFQVLVREFCFNMFEHPRQRDGERDAWLLQVAGGHFPSTATTLASLILIRTVLCQILCHVGARTIFSFSVTGVSHRTCELASSHVAKIFL